MNNYIVSIIDKDNLEILHSLFVVENEPLNKEEYNKSEQIKEEARKANRRIETIFSYLD